MKKENSTSVSTSQVVRDYAAQNPELGQSQIVKDLVAQGHKVYPALVSQALRGTGGGKKQKGAKRGRKPAAAKTAKTAKTAKVAKAKTMAKSAEFNLDSLKLAANFIKQCGSVEKAIAAIQSYEKIAALVK